MKKFGLPILLIILIAISSKFLVQFTDDQVGNFLYIIVMMALLFNLGLTLNTHKKTRGQTWIKKVIASLVVLLFLIYQLSGTLVFNELHTFFGFIGLNQTVIYLIYVYCGWIFFT